jgi:hypothetical protein
LSRGLVEEEEGQVSGKPTVTAAVVILVKGILNLALGFLHIAGTFTFERAKVAGQMAEPLRRDYLVWYYGVGLFIVFMGVLDIVCYGGLREGARSAWRVAVWCSAFNVILGLSGVLAFGVSPPLQLLVTGVVGLVVLGADRSRRESPAPVATGDVREPSPDHHVTKRSR